MAGVHRAGLHQDVRRARKRPKRQCRPAPLAPTGLTGEYDRDEGGRGGHRIRAKLRWDEVTADTAGRAITLDAYKVEVEYSPNGTDWYVRSRHWVPAKDDTDPGTKAHLIIRGIRGRLQYRYRVRAISRAGCKSAWSSYYELGSPGAEEPPAPTNVRIHQSSTDRLVVDWDETPDPNDQERRRDDQSWFVVQWSTSPTFASIYRRDRKVQRNQVGLKVPDADKSQTFYARVAAVNDHGDKDVRSVWIPAKITPNSDPNATPDGVNVGSGSAGKTKHKWFFHGRLTPVDETETDDLDIDETLILRKVRVRVKNSPSGRDIIVKLYRNNTTLVATLTLVAGTKRVVADGLSVSFADGDSISCAVTQVGVDSDPGKNMTVLVVFDAG